MKVGMNKMEANTRNFTGSADKNRRQISRPMLSCLGVAFLTLSGCGSSGSDNSTGAADGVGTTASNSINSTGPTIETRGELPDPALDSTAPMQPDTDTSANNSFSDFSALQTDSVAFNVCEPSRDFTNSLLSSDSAWHENEENACVKVCAPDNEIINYPDHPGWAFDQTTNQECLLQAGAVPIYDSERIAFRNDESSFFRFFDIYGGGETWECSWQSRSTVDAAFTEDGKRAVYQFLVNGELHGAVSETGVPLDQLQPTQLGTWYDGHLNYGGISVVSDAGADLLFPKYRQMRFETSGQDRSFHMYKTANDKITCQQKFVDGSPLNFPDFVTNQTGRETPVSVDELLGIPLNCRMYSENQYQEASPHGLFTTSTLDSSDTLDYSGKLEYVGDVTIFDDFLYHQYEFNEAASLGRNRGTEYTDLQMLIQPDSDMTRFSKGFSDRLQRGNDYFYRDDEGNLFFHEVVADYSGTLDWTRESYCWAQ